MKRRKFITLLGSTAIAWPLAARAQQVETIRRVGVLTPWLSSDAEARDRVTAFAQALQQLGWIDGKMSVSNIVLTMASPTPCENLRPNWSRSLRTSSLPFPAPLLRRSGSDPHHPDSVCGCR